MSGFIGLFDSGLGGLSVARVLLERFPSEPLWVVGDTAHVPYGGRPLPEVHAFAIGLTDYLVRGGCKAVVMACNISSAVALDDARREFSVPVFGMVEAGARAALLCLDEGPVGVMATEGTIRSGAYTRTLTSLRPGVEIASVACPDFVPLVESGNSLTEEAFDAARRYAAPLVEAGTRTVVLGCTHYPFLEEAIRRAFPYPVVLVDPAITVAQDLQLLLTSEEDYAAPPIHRFESTSSPDTFAVQGSILLERSFSAAHCPVWDREDPCRGRRDVRTVESKS